jgi:osmotically-inducible protein OsmY
MTLTDKLRSHAEKHAAEAAARRVKGVKALAGEIEVQFPIDTQRSDGEMPPEPFCRGDIAMVWAVS